MRHREDAAGQAEAIIEQSVANWQNQLRGQQAVGTIRAFRDSLGAMRDIELDKALAAIAQGQSPEQVLRQLAHGLTNKILHVPTTRLKRAGEQGDSDYIRWTRDLFALPNSGEVSPLGEQHERDADNSAGSNPNTNPDNNPDNNDINTQDGQ